MVAWVVASFSSCASKFIHFIKMYLFLLNPSILNRLVGVEKSANVQTIIEKYDEDQDGKLTFGEFLKSVSQYDTYSIFIFIFQ